MQNSNKSKIKRIINVHSVFPIIRVGFENSPQYYESHNFSGICFVKNGQCQVHLNESFVLDQGCLIIYGPDSFRGIDKMYAMNCSADIIRFGTEAPAMRNLYNRPIKLDALQVEAYQNLIAQGETMFQSIDSDEKLQQFVLSLEMFLLDLYMRLDQNTIVGMKFEKDQYYKGQMNKLTHYLMDNIKESISIEQMVSALCTSETSLRRLVHRYRGCGPLAYFQQLKINEAKRLLLTTDMNITQVAITLGYCGVHYFSRVFHLKTGMSPSAYVKMVKNN